MEPLLIALLWAFLFAVLAYIAAGFFAARYRDILALCVFIVALLIQLT